MARRCVSWSMARIWQRTRAIISVSCCCSTAMIPKLLKWLACGGMRPRQTVPKLPLPGFESVGWQALVAPTGTPDTVVAKVNADVIKAMRDPEIRKRLADLGRDDRTMSPSELLTFIHDEQAKWTPIVQTIAA